MQPTEPDEAPTGGKLAVSRSGECSRKANITVVLEDALDDQVGPRPFARAGGMTIRLPDEPAVCEIRYMSPLNPHVVYSRRKLTIR